MCRERRRRPQRRSRIRPPNASKGPKVILHCGAATETFTVTPGNSVEYQPHGDQYDIVVTLPDGSLSLFRQRLRESVGEFGGDADIEG